MLFLNYVSIVVLSLRLVMYWLRIGCDGCSFDRVPVVVVVVVLVLFAMVVFIGFSRWCC